MYLMLLTVFDPATIRHNATYDDTHEWATGVSAVIVNGQIELKDSEYTGKLTGKVLRLS